MANINSNIRQKTFGIMKSIEIMNDSERSQRPSKSFGENYNNLRALCETNNSGLVSLLPPQVEFDNYGFDGSAHLLTEHNFSEIHTFCSEIYHLLEDAE